MPITVGIQVCLNLVLTSLRSSFHQLSVCTAFLHCFTNANVCVACGTTPEALTASGSGLVFNFCPGPQPIENKLKIFALLMRTN